MATLNVTASGTLKFRDAAPSWMPGTPRPFGPYTYRTPFSISAASHLSLSGVAAALAHRTYSVSAASHLGLADSNAVAANRRIAVAASTSLLVAPAGAAHMPSPRASGSVHLAFLDRATATKNSSLSVSASIHLALSASASQATRRVLSVSAASAFGITPLATVPGIHAVAATTQLLVSPTAATSRTHAASASSSFLVVPSASSSRAAIVSAASHFTLVAADTSPAVRQIVAASQFHIAMATDVAIGHPHATTTLAFHDRADARVNFPEGAGIPGGDSSSGLRAIVATGISGDYPFSYAETPSGLLLLANGVDPMQRWDALTGVAEPAGVIPPISPIALAGTGVGELVGLRYAFTRYVDRHGNPSSLSPVSNAVNLGRDALIDDIAIDPVTGAVTLTSVAHGLFSGEVVIFRNVGGLSLIDGPIVVHPVDGDTFTIPLAITSGQWTGGGSWCWGVKTVVYQQVPITTDSKVARRQILRNLDGSLDTLYVDIDTDDLKSTTFTSTRTDDDLAACEPVPISGEDDLPFANRYGVPPAHKAVLANHLGRVFAAVDVTITAGCVRPVFGATTIRGVATAWTNSLAGRFLYVSGATRAYEILSVDAVHQVLNLVGNYTDQTISYALYAIRPAPAERKLLYYSEPGQPEAWPPWNAVEMPNDSDEITGLMIHSSFLYLVERRHLYRFTMQHDPATDGFTFLTVERGCVNNRCWVKAEGTAYLLDDSGIYSFDGQAADPISKSIQNLFQGEPSPDGLQVDWMADRTLWHAGLDPAWNTIRWFVRMVGYPAIMHAICYDYRLKRWWIEQFPTAITSSTVGTVAGRVSLVGTSARRVLCLGQNVLDGVDATTGTLRGLVTSASATTLVDSAAAFAAHLAGAPVQVTSGTGRGQQRMLASNTSTSLEVVLPWDVIPDGTSTYQVGGIPWEWRSGWFEFVDDQSDNTRNLRLTYRPLASPATANVQLYYDHARTPRVWAYDQSRDGITMVAGDPMIAVDMTGGPVKQGQALVRISGHADANASGDSFVSLHLSGVQAHEPVRFQQLLMAGVLRGDRDDD